MAQRKAKAKKSSTPDDSVKRPKATDLVYHPNQWLNHKYIIHAHFNGTLCHSLLTAADPKCSFRAPTIDRAMGTALLLDDSRPNQDGRPPLPNAKEIDPMFWTCSTYSELLDMINDLEPTDNRRWLGSKYKLQLDDYSSHPSIQPWIDMDSDGDDPPSVVNLDIAEAHAYSDYDEAMQLYQDSVVAYAKYERMGFEAKEEAGEPPAPPGDAPPHPRRVCFDTIRLFHNVNHAWRENNPPNMMLYQKQNSALLKIIDSVSHLSEYKYCTPPQQSYLYREANQLIFVLMNQYIGKKYKHLKQSTLDEHGKTAMQRRDGVALFNRCNIMQAKPSVSTGARLAAQLQRARQHPGTTFEYWVDFLFTLEDDYKTASGRKYDRALTRLTLENVTPFYQKPFSALLTNQSITGKLLPIRASGDTPSIVGIMNQYESDNFSSFKQYVSAGNKSRAMKKKKKHKDRRRRPGQRHGEAHLANQRPGNRPPKKKGDKWWLPGPMPQTCTWCKKFNPTQATSHTERDCNTKKQYSGMACHNCGQQGHPARMCPNTKGHANLADESKSQTTGILGNNNILSLSRPMTSKEVRSQLKGMQPRNDGRRTKYRLIEVQLTDEDCS